MSNTSSDSSERNPIAEQQDALNALINNLGRVIGTDAQNLWVTKVINLKNSVSSMNVDEQSNYRLKYDADRVDAATSLVDKSTKDAIESVLRGIQPVRKQKHFVDSATNQTPNQISL